MAARLQDTYRNEVFKQMMEKFQQRNGATQCKLLKGVGTSKPLRDCPDCVADASEFLEEILENL